MITMRTYWILIKTKIYFGIGNIFYYINIIGWILSIIAPYLAALVVFYLGVHYFILHHSEFTLYLDKGYAIDKNNPRVAMLLARQNGYTEAWNDRVWVWFRAFFQIHDNTLLGIKEFLAQLQQIRFSDPEQYRAVRSHFIFATLFNFSGPKIANTYLACRQFYVDYGTAAMVAYFDTILFDRITLYMNLTKKLSYVDFKTLLINCNQWVFRGVDIELLELKAAAYDQIASRYIQYPEIYASLKEKAAAWCKLTKFANNKVHYDVLHTIFTIPGEYVTSRIYSIPSYVSASVWNPTQYVVSIPYQGSLLDANVVLTMENPTEHDLNNPMKECWTHKTFSFWGLSGLPMYWFHMLEDYLPYRGDVDKQYCSFVVHVYSVMVAGLSTALLDQFWPFLKLCDMAIGFTVTTDYAEIYVLVRAAFFEMVLLDLLINQGVPWDNLRWV